MARHNNKPSEQAASQLNTLEITVSRVKKDLVYILVSSVVAIGLGLIIGNFIKF